MNQLIYESRIYKSMNLESINLSIYESMNVFFIGDNPITIIYLCLLSILPFFSLF